MIIRDHLYGYISLVLRAFISDHEVCINEKFRELHFAIRITLTPIEAAINDDVMYEEVRHADGAGYVVGFPRQMMFMGTVGESHC